MCAHLPFYADGSQYQYRTYRRDVLEVMDSFTEERTHGPSEGE